MKRSLRTAALLCCAFFGTFAGFPTAAQPAHHTAAPRSTPWGPDGFRNNYPHPGKESFWEWKWEQWRHGVAQAPSGGWRIPQMKTDAAALRANTQQPIFTWIGHAAFLLQLGGQNILVDAQFSEMASPLPLLGPKRIVALPLELDELPRIDVVLTSHNHYDHLDLDTVKRLAARPPGSPLFLVPLGLKRWFNDQGIDRVEELDWWQAREVGNVRYTLVPVQHWSKRTLWDANQSLWGGWAMEGAGLKVIHTGDLGLSRDVDDIGARLGPFDLALIPIGSYAPRWFMRTMHVDVSEALKVRASLRAARAVGMHWGTFENLADEPLDVMKIGETRSIVHSRATPP